MTGAGGFAGQWLVRRLVTAGARVSAWSNRARSWPFAGAEHRQIDITNADACRRAMRVDDPDVVFHLAAVTHPAFAEASPDLTWAVNVDGTRHVVEAAPARARVVHVSTCHVYGRPRQLPLSVGHPLEPVGVYATTKAEAERTAQRVRPETVVARAFHHTGPGQSPKFALAGWAEALARSERVLHVGDLSVRRDYCDVRDIVEGYLVLAERAPAGAIVDLCSGEAPTLRELLDCMNREGAEIVVDPSRLRADDVRELRGDPTAARDLGWAPDRDLGETLWEMVERGR